MCGRFTQTHPNDALARLFAARPANDLPDGPRYNICPTQPVAVVTGGEDGRRLVAMRWGFLPAWYRTPSDGPLLINARAESLATKPAFREAARARRCVIPASGFYEWTKDAEGRRLPWYVRPGGSGPFAFAGIWQVWERDGMPHVTCAIVTTAAAPALRAIHHRMPLVIAGDDRALWLGEAGHGAARLMSAAHAAAAADAAGLVCHRVGQAVNASRAEGPDLVAPLDGDG